MLCYSTVMHCDIIEIWETFCPHSIDFCLFCVRLSSVQFGRSVMSDSLRPHESQHARPSCLSPTPGVHSNSRPSSWWCHPVISSSVVPFSSCPQSLPASDSFPMSQLFAWGGQSTEVSALASHREGRNKVRKTFFQELRRNPRAYRRWQQAERKFEYAGFVENT